MAEAAEPALDRMQKLLISVDRSMKILEFGPSFGPVAAKRDGWQSYSLDHADANALREKYAGCADVDISKIEDVDFVCSDGHLLNAIPQQHLGGFDCCIASHVLEHIPDLLQFFKSMEVVLAPNAIISLALPDKRYCIDFFKPITTAADILYAHHRSLRRHTKKTAFEHFAYGVLWKGQCGWGQQPLPGLSLLGNIFEADQLFEVTEETEDSPYADFHCWYFTPASFALIILELGALGRIDWHIERAFPATGCEFFATLRRGAPTLDPEALQQARLRLLQDIIAEAAEQHRWLVAAAETAETAEPDTPAEQAETAEHAAPAEPENADMRPSRARKWRRKIARKVGSKVSRMVRRGVPPALRQ